MKRSRLRYFHGRHCELKQKKVDDDNELTSSSTVDRMMTLRIVLCSRKSICMCDVIKIRGRREIKRGMKGKERRRDLMEEDVGVRKQCTWCNKGCQGLCAQLASIPSTPDIISQIMLTCHPNNTMPFLHGKLLLLKHGYSQCIGYIHMRGCNVAYDVDISCDVHVHLNVDVDVDVDMHGYTCFVVATLSKNEEEKKKQAESVLEMEFHDSSNQSKPNMKTKSEKIEFSSFVGLCVVMLCCVVVVMLCPRHRKHCAKIDIMCNHNSDEHSSVTSALQHILPWVNLLMFVFDFGFHVIATNENRARRRSSRHGGHDQEPIRSLSNAWRGLPSTQSPTSAFHHTIPSNRDTPTPTHTSKCIDFLFFWHVAKQTGHDIHPTSWNTISPTHNVSPM